MTAVRNVHTSLQAFIHLTDIREMRYAFFVVTLLKLLGCASAQGGNNSSSAILSASSPSFYTRLSPADPRDGTSLLPTWLWLGGLSLVLSGGLIIFFVCMRYCKHRDYASIPDSKSNSINTVPETPSRILVEGNDTIVSTIKTYPQTPSGIKVE